MGFLATSKARSARSLASASTPASRHRISTRSGCSCGSCESSWNAVAGRRSSLSKRSSPDPGGARRETPPSSRCAALSVYFNTNLVSTLLRRKTESMAKRKSENRRGLTQHAQWEQPVQAHRRLFRSRRLHATASLGGGGEPRRSAASRRNTRLWALPYFRRTDTSRGANLRSVRFSVS